MKEMKYKTIGRRFVEDISKANTKEELFKTLKDSCCKAASPEKVGKELEKMDFPASKEVAKLKATMAKVKINASEAKFQKALDAATNEKQLVKLMVKHLQMEKMFSRAQDYAVIGMDAYLEKGFGTPEEFKREAKKLFAPDAEKSINTGWKEVSKDYKKIIMV